MASRDKGKGAAKPPTPDDDFPMAPRGTETGQFARYWESEGGEATVESQELPTAFAEDVDDEDRRPERALSRGAWFAYFGGAFVLVLVAILGVSWLVSRGADGGAPDAPGSSATGSPTASPGPTHAPEPEPTWNTTPLAGVDLPAAHVPVNPDEPAALVMEDRIWNYVGPGWALAVNENGFDSEAPTADAFQALYLISPEGHVFFLYNLRKDYKIGIEHWDPVERVAWTHRYGQGDGYQTVELALLPGKTTEAWVDENESARDVESVKYIATLADGTTLWHTSDYRGDPARFLKRAPGAAAQMFSIFSDTEALDPDGRFIEYWIDADSAVAYFRADTWASGEEDDVSSIWYRLDIASGDGAELDGTPPAPEGYRCSSAGHVTIDGLLVASCTSDAETSTWLLDPSGTAAPIHYSGVIPDLPSTSERIDLDPTEFGTGWSAVRALP